MKSGIDRPDKVFMYAMEQNGTSADVGNVGSAVEGNDNSQTAAAAMTYANLETLTRLNTEDLTSILSSSNQPTNHQSHYTDTSAASNQPTAGYIVSMATELANPDEASSAEAFALANPDTFAVASRASEDGANVDDSPNDNDDPQLRVHTYCKSSLRVCVSGADAIDDVDEVGNPTSLGADSVANRSTELLDLKTVLPGPTTRRVLLIDDGHGDLEMAKSDVEFLLRGDAATVVLREGKRSEVWARFGKIFFQGRKIKGYVACRACNQVYAFGDAHSTGTSTLKKHRCMAPSMVTSVSPLTPTLTSHSPAPPLSQSSDAYGNFPSPSVIVSISTMRTPDGSSDASGALPTRYLAPHERDELIRSAGVVLGAGSISGSTFLTLAKTLVELGAKHGSAVADDLSVIFKSPSFELILPGVAYELQNHFVQEARACAGGGVGVIITVEPTLPTSRVMNVTLKMSYATNSSNPVLQQTPLRCVQLQRDADLAANMGALVKRMLKEERLDHLRRAILCNCGDVLNAAFYGEMTSICALTVVEKTLHSANSSIELTEWKQFHDTIQQIANAAQSNGWANQLSKPLRPTDAGLDWLQLVVNTSQQVTELHKLWTDHHQDASVWNALDRYVLTHVSVFSNSVLTAVGKLNDAGSTLCNVLLVKSHVMSLCTPKSNDPSALLAFKQSLLASMQQHWRLELIHRMACVFHPAFKHMRRLDISDRERSETYSMVRNLLRHIDLLPSDHILRNTLESVKNGDLKRKGRNEASTPKRQRTSSTSSAAPPPLPLDATFDFNNLADFGCASDVCGLVPERDELDLYLEEKVIQQEMTELNNVLVYWKNRKNVFPALTQLAFWILSLPPATYSYDSCLSKCDAVTQRMLFHSVNQSNSAAAALGTID